MVLEVNKRIQFINLIRDLRAAKSHDVYYLVLPVLVAVVFYSFFFADAVSSALVLGLSIVALLYCFETDKLFIRVMNSIELCLVELVNAEKFPYDLVRQALSENFDIRRAKILLLDLTVELNRHLSKKK